jgi:DNA-binding NarL/FixJ family response regulator
MLKKGNGHRLRIILADDHTILRQGLAALLRQQTDMEVIAEASNGIDAVVLARELLPDVVIMDIGMAEMDGARATETLKRELPQIKVIALTVQEDTAYLSQMLKAGASGYVLKRVASEELVHAIRIVAAGGHYLDPDLTRQFTPTAFGQPPGIVNEHAALSRREADVLKKIALGYTNKEIASALSISVKTVETYKSRLMVKLELRSRVDIVRYALHQGWLE